MTLVDKAVSPVVYLIGVDHIQDVIDSLSRADQALLEVVNRFREKLKPDRSISVVLKVRLLSS